MKSDAKKTKRKTVKYQEIALKIEKYIEKNNLQQGEKLPNLEALVIKFGASKSTIRKALELLEKKGRIYQLQGSGIFVRKLKRRGYVNLAFSRGFKQDFANYEIDTKVITLEVRPANHEVASNLNISFGTNTYYVKRLRFIHGQPLCIEEAYFEKSIVTYLNKEIVTDSIFSYLQEALNLNLGFSDTYLYVDRLSKDEAQYLKLQEGDPKMLIESIFYLSTGQAFNYSKITYNYRQSQFFIQAISH